MTALAKQLGAGLNVQQSAQVSSIARKGGQWECSLNTGESIHAASVVITIPVPQALELFSAGDLKLEEAIYEKLVGIKYHRCFSVMAVLAGSSNVPMPGGVAMAEGPISWIADNQRKGISDKPAVTIHASPEFSLTHWDGDREQTACELLRLAAPWLGSEIVEYRMHGWKFSMPVSAQEEDCLLLYGEPNMVIAGDAFGGGRVEGAVLSGWAAARALA
jgi:predicted NAD/FAD-dependent oxidoreductase